MVTLKPLLLRGASLLAAATLSSGGATMAMLGVMVPLTMGFAAVATDLALWQAQRRDLQMAADAAAISGAREMARQGHTEQEILDAAAHDASLNGYEVDAETTISVVPDTDAGTVQVVVRQTAPTFFARMLLTEEPAISGHATAAVRDPLNNACIVALDPDAQNALILDSNSQVIANGCGVHVNSDDPQAMHTAANADVEAEDICVVGSYSGSGYTPVPETGCDPIDDPFAGIDEPAAGACDETDFATDHGTHTLTPGVYCGGISAISNAELDFQPGTYVIKDGPLHLDSNVVASGDGVTFFFTGTGAVLDLDSNVSFDFSAPTTGDHAGMLLMEDDDNPLLQEHRLNSNGDLLLDGTVYLPRGQLEMDSNSTAGNTASYTNIIARRIHLDSNAVMEVNAFAGGPVPQPTALTKTVALIQ